MKPEDLPHLPTIYPRKDREKKCLADYPILESAEVIAPAHSFILDHNLFDYQSFDKEDVQSTIYPIGLIDIMNSLNVYYYRARYPNTTKGAGKVGVLDIEDIKEYKINKKFE